MSITARTEYACLAMLDLAAAHETGELVRIKRIAERHGIPSRFLVQILLQLKQAGLVRSTRGAAGGYRLTRSPETISLLHILEAVDKVPREFVSNVPRATPSRGVLASTWNRLLQCQHEQLQGVNLADLDRQARDQTAGMYYI
jgi:Rrf2 family protein